MPTTQADIARWLARAQSHDATHMIIVCDTFEYQDYPVFVSKTEDIHERIKHFTEAPMQRIIEVYNMAMPIADQVAERRAWHP